VVAASGQAGRKGANLARPARSTNISGSGPNSVMPISLR
jgi:hypothetical protein